MSGEQTTTQTETEQPASGGNDFSVIKNHMMRDGKASIMFLARSFAAINGFTFAIASFFNPVLAYACFQRLMFAFGLASVIRLSQRLGPVQFTKQYMISVVLEDSAHYMLFACNFYAHKTTTVIGVIPTLYCLLQATAFLLAMLQECHNPTWDILKRQLNKVKENQQQLLRVVASAEIFVMPVVIIQLFTGQCGSILTPLVYYQFLMLRYMSRRNPYVRNAFTELKMAINQLLYKPACPGIIRTVITKVMGLIEKLSPMTYEQAQAS
ncbi:transmembrane protein 33-like [Bolinopsis microptera]|uniref:transmembrane protein 33-like n=1 Tax=Bolinopsis microptera TaxID=2820187 RepID=UPI003079C93B